jgi:hypothetical protein
MDPKRLFKGRVLVVEDDPLVLETTAAVVRSLGFRFALRRMDSLPCKFLGKFCRT